MKAITILFAFLLGALSTKAQSIEGLWNTGQESTVIIIKSFDGKLDGRIHSSDNVQATRGTLIIKDIQKSNGIYTGKIYSLKKKKWFDATLEPKSDLLNVKILAGLATKTFSWRVTN